VEVVVELSEVDDGTISELSLTVRSVRCFIRCT
jgi:hypothetical protein